MGLLKRIFGDSGYIGDERGYRAFGVDPSRSYEAPFAQTPGRIQKVDPLMGGSYEVPLVV